MDPSEWTLLNGIPDLRRFAVTPYPIRHVLIEMAILAVSAILSLKQPKTAK